jgi:carbon monoxide dehydrogenase subunit G
MELSNEFEVAVPPEVAWAVLTDVEKIAPCLPGAQLKEIDGDEFRGAVKVKVGPITASYQGTAHFEELDVKALRAVLKAGGRDTRGQGNATALITAQLSPSDRGTLVKVHTDLSITGKVAQFGRGVLDDVSGKLLAQFVENLEASVLAPGASEPAAAAAPDLETSEGGVATPAGAAEAKASEVTEAKPTAPSGPRVIDHGPVEPVDLVGVAGGSVMKQFAPQFAVAGIAFLLLIVIYALRRRNG